MVAMPKPHRQVIGVDIGGTGLKLGRFDSEGQLLAEQLCPTPQPPAPGAITTALVEAIEALDPERQAESLVSLPEFRCVLATLS